MNEPKSLRRRRRNFSVKYLSVAALPVLILTRLAAGQAEYLGVEPQIERFTLPLAAGPAAEGCCGSETTATLPAPARHRGLAVPLALPGREPVCALALNPASDGAATAMPNVSVVLAGCRLFSNSASSSAVSLPHSAHLSALAVGAVGGIVGEQGIAAVLGVSSGNAPVQDPFRAVPLPDFAGCDQVNFEARTNVVVRPGVFCGGLKLAPGADVRLSAGLYIFDRGSLTVASGARLSGAGVALVFTSSTGQDYATARLAPGAGVHLSAAAEGLLAGILIYGDRRMSQGAPFKLEAGADQDFAGATYLPRAALSFAGTSAGCTQVIADTITFTGPTRLALSCAERTPKPLAGTSPSLYWLVMDRPMSVSPSTP